MSAFDSALCSLCYLLFKPIWLRSSLCALCVLLWQSVLAGVHYVDVNSTNGTPPYTNWTTAAMNIQDAVDAAVEGDIVLVTNGVYRTGGKTASALVDGTNRVAVTKALSVQSVNGPAVTIIQGFKSLNASAVRCACLTNGASLSGFTLTNGGTAGSYVGGAGVWCQSTDALVTNCVLRGNSSQVGGWGGGAFQGTLVNCALIGNIGASGGGAAGGLLINCALAGNSATDISQGFGGGATYCTLSNCTLTGNSSHVNGGGAYQSVLSNCILTGNIANGGGGTHDSTLYNCTVTGNIAQSGGGVLWGTCRNCIVYYNSAPSFTNYGSKAIFDYSCTAPLPASGAGNITNEPAFVDQADGNLRLQSNSPCINGGNNAYAPAGPDLDGNPRIAGGTADIGAYEFQSPVSRISYAWLQHFNLPINPATDTADPDGDGVDNYHEWLAGSDPTNPFSFPPLLTLIPYGPNVILTWPTNAFGFTLQSTTNLGSLVWTTNSPAPIVIGGQNVIINPIIGAQQFYRLVQY